MAGEPVTGDPAIGVPAAPVLGAGQPAPGAGQPVQGAGGMPLPTSRLKIQSTGYEASRPR